MLHSFLQSAEDKYCVLILSRIKYVDFGRCYCYSAYVQ